MWIKYSSSQFRLLAIAWFKVAVKESALLKLKMYPFSHGVTNSLAPVMSGTINGMPYARAVVPINGYVSYQMDGCTTASL